MITADIKNMSIALEALSRIPDSRELSDKIRDELSEFLYELTRRRRKAQNKEASPDTTPDDDIPF